MTHGAWKGPSNTANTQASLVTTEGDSESVVKSVVKLPPVMAGMDRVEALAFVSRLYDSAQAGAHIWGDALLVKRFLTQCSRTGSQEMLKKGYLAATSCYTNLAHTQDVIEPYLDALDEVSALIAECEAGRSVEELLNGPVCHGGFKRLN